MQQYGRASDTRNQLTDQDDQQIEDMFQFLDSIKASNRDLYDGELEREGLENQMMAYKVKYNQTKRNFSDIKEEQENYLHVLQVLYMRALKLHKAYSFQNSMMYDILAALKRRNELAASIENDTQKLKSMLQPAKRGPASKSKDKDNSGLVEGETSVLRVELKKSGKTVLLYKNMWICTPMGEGQVITILPLQQKIIIKLPFGLMYSHIARVVSWGQKGESLDTVSDQALQEEWDHIKNNINITWKRLQQIRSIVDPMEEIEQTTDGDDDNSVDESAGENEATVRPQIPAPISQSIPMDTQSSNNEFTVNIGSYKTMEPKNRLFPIQSSSDPSVPNARELLRKSVYKDSFTDPLPLTNIALASVPPAAAPYIVEKIYKEGGNRTIIHKSALQDGGVGGTTGSLGWSGEIDELKAGLQFLGDQIRKLEGEQRSYISAIESIRHKCTSYYQNTAAIRLGIYSRRNRHRNNLQLGGQIAAPIVPVLQTVPTLSATEKIADNVKKSTVVHSDNLSNTNDVELGKKRARDSPPNVGKKESTKVEKGKKGKNDTGELENKETKVDIKVEPLKEEKNSDDKKKRARRI